MTFNRNKLRFALLMSLRETRAAVGKFAFLVLAIALGTGALTAVTGFNASVRYTLITRSTIADGRRHFRAAAAPAAPVRPSRR